MKLTLGRMREGKTFAAAAEMGPGKLLVLDRQADLGRLVIEQNLWRKDRVFAEQLSRTDRTCKTVNVWESGAASAIDRIAEDKAVRHDFIEIMAAGRNLNQWENVLIYEHAEEAVGLLQYQRKFKPAYWLAEICKWNSREANELLNDCRDHEFKEAFRGWLLMNAFQFKNEIGPAKRLLSILGEAAVMARCGDIDCRDIFDRYDVVVVIGEGASDAEATFMIHHWLSAAADFGEIEVTADESDKIGSPGVGVYTNKVLRTIKMEEKHGFQFHGIMQTGHALLPEIFSDLLDMSSEINCFALGDPRSVETMAKVMGTPNLDPHKIHHVTKQKRQYNDGFDQVIVKDEIPFKEWAPRDENLTGEVRKRTSLVPRYRVEEEETEHYESLTDQEKRAEKAITTLRKRERFVRCGPHSWKEKVKTLQNPYLWPEVSAKRVDEFLEEMVWRPEFTETLIQKPTSEPFYRGKPKDKGTGKK